MSLTACRLTRLCLAAALAVPVLLATTVSPTPAAAAGPTARISVSSMEPIVARPGDSLHLAGSVTNISQQVLRGVEVRLRLSKTPLGSRDELNAVAAGRTEAGDGDVVTEARPSPRDLRPGEEVGYDLTVQLSGPNAFDEFGVYVVGVEVLAGSRGGFGRAAIRRTFLPWVPSDPGLAPTGFTWMWPVVDQPRRLANGAFADDGLASAIAPGGRLDRLVTEGQRLETGTPLVWAVDPDLAETVDDMRDGYQVQSRDGTSVDGGASGLASIWLDQLKSATTNSTVLALPYADVDLVALSRNGLTRDIRRSRDLGSRVATAVLQRPVRDDVVWPYDGFSNRQALATLRDEGVQAVLLDAAARPPSTDLSYTPSGRTSIVTNNGRLSGLLADPKLSALLGVHSASPILDAQRFVAETAMISAELPAAGTARVIVVAPPRTWDPDPILLDRVVEGTLQASWMAPVGLDQLLSTPVPPVARKPLRYPAAARRAELPRTYLSAVRSMQYDITVFAAVLSQPQGYVPTLNRSVLRLESTYWRHRPGRVNRLADEQTHVAELRQSIRVLPGHYTLGSSSGTIPLTIVNDLSQQVTVALRLTPQTRRLEVRQVGPVVIGARSKEQVEVPVNAVATGVVLVEARLLTPGGAPYSQPVTLEVRVTQYGTVALFITVGAASVLFLAAGIRLVRRAMASRRG